MQLVFDTLYIIFIVLGIIWWTRRGRTLAVRYVWPTWLWASWPGWMIGLLVTLSVVAWIRSALTQIFFQAQP